MCCASQARMRQGFRPERYFCSSDRKTRPPGGGFYRPLCASIKTSEAPPQTDEACCAKTSLSFRAKSLAEGQWLRTRPFETLASLAPQGEVLVLRSARSARLEAPGSPPLCFGAPE